MTAIEDKDAANAGRWMAEHIEETRASIESWLQPKTRPGRAP